MLCRPGILTPLPYNCAGLYLTFGIRMGWGVHDLRCPADIEHRPNLYKFSLEVRLGQYGCARGGLFQFSERFNGFRREAKGFVGLLPTIGEWARHTRKVDYKGIIPVDHPNKRKICRGVLGKGNSSIALTFSGSTFRVPSPTLYPRYFISL